MKIGYRVQHAAGRESALDPLLPLLPPAVEVITDEEAESDPNPLRCFLRCLANPGPGVTHLCVLQDDVTVCTDFERRVEDAVAGRPADILSLFVGGLHGRTQREFLSALKAGNPWTQVYFREIHHVVATVWPVTQAQAFLDWWETKPKVPGPRVQRSDDAVVGYWARRKQIRFWATVPCLVEHRNELPSTIRQASRFGDKGRRAISFLG